VEARYAMVISYLSTTLMPLNGDVRWKGNKM